MSTTLTSPLTIKQRLTAGAAAFKTGEDLQTKLTTLEVTHAAASAEIDRLTQALDASEKLTATANETIAAHVITIATRDTTITGLNAQIAELPAKISAGVTEKAAELGFPLSKMPKAESSADIVKAPQSEGESAAAVEAEQDPAKRKALYSAHRKAFPA